MKHAKIISSKSVFNVDKFEVKENTVDYGNGIVKIHHDVQRQPAVSILPLTENFEVFLIEQYRYLLNKKVTEVIAGFIDEGEDELTAAKRELQEETGLVANKWTEITSLFAAGSVITWKQTIFIAKNLKEGKATPEETEDIKLIKMTIDEAVNKVLTGEISTGSSAFSILLLNTLKNKQKL